MGPADRAPFGSAGGGDRTKSRSRRSTRAVYPASELSGEITLLLLLVCRWRVIQEQLSSRQSFCWSGGRQWRTVRGAGYARTSNYVRRSSIPSRRPCLARAKTLACMLVLSTPRSTSSILVQQTYGTANTMTLSVLRLLRWARCMYGRRGPRRDRKSVV